MGSDERRGTEAGSYPVISPWFGLLTARREGSPACGCPSKRESENHPQTWPLRNRQTLQIGALSGHPKLGCGLCDGFGLLVCKTEHCVIGQLDLEYLGKITRTTKQKTKRRRKNSKLLQILVCWRSLLCRLFKKTVSVGILLRFLLLYIHVANFIANKALRTRSAEETYGNAIPCCSNNYYSIDMSTHTHTCAYWTCKIRKVFIVLS